MKWHPPATLLRFVVVGAGVALLYLVLSLLLERLFGNLLAASITAFTAAVIVQYLGHRYYTFRSANASTREIPRFVAVVSLGALLSLLLVTVAERFALPSLVPLLGVAMLTPIVNWVLFSAWVFVSSNERTTRERW